MQLGDLKEKVGPLPMYVWVGGGAALIVAIGLYLKHKGASTPATGSLIVNSGTPTVGAGGGGGGGSVSPGAPGAGSGAPPLATNTPIFAPMPTAPSPAQTQAPPVYVPPFQLGNSNAPSQNPLQGIPFIQPAPAPSWEALSTPSHQMLQTEVLQHPSAPFGNPNWAIDNAQSGALQIVDRTAPGIPSQSVPGGQITYFRPRVG